jgi:outer membrane immunogenic protein
MIRRILLASVGAMALAGTAFAADLPTLAPPPPPPPVWTGFCLGVNAGYEWAASKW